MKKTQILFSYKEDNYPLFDNNNQIENNNNIVENSKKIDIKTEATNEKNKSSLPNIWDLVDSFIKKNNNIKYCMNYKSFYNYRNNFWSPINKDQLTRIIINFLKTSYPKDFKKFNLKSLDEVFLLISQHEEFSMPNAIANANANGFLLPFLNGVLNTKTLELFPHSPNNYTTHIIPLNYSKEDTIKNTIFAEFLIALVNNNPMRLQILRACLYLIFTNNLIYQIALYIYGPGGTGKSTLVNILIYLLGKEVTLSSGLSQITSRFGIASLVGKLLLILNDVSLYRGQEPKAIKNIVTQDPMEAEIKYKQPFSFIPQSFLVVTSNTLWDIKNSTTGLSRRMIYFPFDNVPNHKELDLFRILPNGEVVGSLVPHLGGFINWILTCPKEYKELLYQGGSKVTELISQDSIHVNPLHIFVKDCLLQDNNYQIRININSKNYKNNKNKSLYGSYINWCEANSINTISIKSFSILILDLLKQLGWDIKKRRTNVGFVIEGVNINDNWQNKTNSINENPNLLKYAGDIDNHQSISTNIVKLDKITENDFNNT